MNIEETIQNKKSVDNKIKYPSQYKVIFYNDDFTPFDFVEAILTTIFNKTKEESESISKAVHTNGKAIVGIYIKEIASTKKHLVDACSFDNKFPLVCEIEVENN